MNDAPLDPERILADIEASLECLERATKRLQTNVCFLHDRGERKWPKGRAKAVADRLVPVAGALDALGEWQEELVEIDKRAQVAIAELMDG